MSSLPLVRTFNNFATRWIQKPAGSPLIPEILDIIIEYAEGYEEVKYILPRLLAEIRSPHYIIAYQTYWVNHDLITGAVRVSRYQICGDLNQIADEYNDVENYDEAGYFLQMKNTVLHQAEKIRIIHIKFGADFLIEEPLN